MNNFENFNDCPVCGEELYFKERINMICCQNAHYSCGLEFGSPKNDTIEMEEYISQNENNNMHIYREFYKSEFQIFDLNIKNKLSQDEDLSYLFKKISIII